MRRMQHAILSHFDKISTGTQVTTATALISRVFVLPGIFLNLSSL
jgi:hypothetical protein